MVLSVQKKSTQMNIVPLLIFSFSFSTLDSKPMMLYFSLLLAFDVLFLCFCILKNNFYTFYFWIDLFNLGFQTYCRIQ